MGVAPQLLLELDRSMLEAIIQVYKDRQKGIEDAKRRNRRSR